MNDAGKGKGEHTCKAHGGIETSAAQESTRGVQMGIAVDALDHITPSLLPFLVWEPQLVGTIAQHRADHHEVDVR